MTDDPQEPSSSAHETEIDEKITKLPVVPRDGEGEEGARADQNGEVIALFTPTAEPQDAAPTDPPKTLFGQLVRQTVETVGSAVASSHADGKKPAVVDILSHPNEHADEPDVVNLTAERLRRHGPKQNHIDIGSIVREELNRVLSPDGETEGGESAEVTIDGEFVRKHGGTLMAALIDSVAKNLSASMVGLSGAPPAAPAATPSDASDQERAPALQEVDTTQLEGEADAPRVRLDFFSVLAELIRPPEPAAESAAPEDGDPDES